LGSVKVKLHGEEGNLYGEGKEFLNAIYGTTRDCRVLEIEGSHNGHV
jgi:hypothetical protein